MFEEKYFLKLSLSFKNQYQKFYYSYLLIFASIISQFIKFISTLKGNDEMAI